MDTDTHETGEMGPGRSQLPEEALRRLDEVALRILRKRYGYVAKAETDGDD